jgi:hypothetical protein
MLEKSIYEVEAETVDAFNSLLNNWRSLLPRSFQALEHRQVMVISSEGQNGGAQQIDGNVFLLGPNFFPLVWSTFPRSRSTFGSNSAHHIQIHKKPVCYLEQTAQSYSV